MHILLLGIGEEDKPSKGDGENRNVGTSTEKENKPILLLGKLQGVHGQAALHAAPLLQAGRQFNRIFFGFSYSLKNHFSFGLKFPTLIKSSKIGSLDISQNQNGISSRFTSQNSSQKFLLNCHSALRRLPRHPEVPRRRPPGGAIQGAGIEGQVRRAEGALRRSHERQPLLSHRHELAVRVLLQCQGGQLQA